MKEHKHDYKFAGNQMPPNLKGVNITGGNPWWKCACGAMTSRPLSKSPHSKANKRAKA